MVMQCHWGQLVTLVTPLMKPRHWGQSHSASLLLAPSRSGRSTHQSHSVSSPPPRSVWSTHQSHYVSSPSATVSVINSPITFCQLPSATVSVINSPITFCQLPSATVSVINSPITFCQLPSATVSVINSPITFCQLPLRHGQCDQLTNHILSAPPPPRSVWSTHQSHSVSSPSAMVSVINSPITLCQLPLRHGQCDQLTNHIMSAPPPPRSVWSTHQSHSIRSPSATVSVINSPITFCQVPLHHGQCDQLTNHILSAPLRHGQCDQLTNHIMSAPPPPWSVWSTHQSHSVSSPSATVSVINSPITLCQLPLRHGQCDQLTNHIMSAPPPPRSVWSTHQSHYVSSPSATVSVINSPITFYQVPLRHGQCDQLTNHILSGPPPPRSVWSTHQSHSVSSPPPRSVWSTHQSHYVSSPSAMVSVINSPITFCQLPLCHGQCDQLTNHILSGPPPPRSVWSTHQSHYVSSPSAMVSVINSPITFCQLPLRHGQCDQLTNHIMSAPPPPRSVWSTHQSHYVSSPSATVSVINSPITFCQLPLCHGQCDQLTNHILSAPPPPRSVWWTHQSHSVSSPSATVSVINSPITFCQLPSATVSVINSPITFCQLPLRHGQCDQLTNHILSAPPPPRSVWSTHQSHSVSSPPPRSVWSTHQSHSVSSPSATVSVMNSPITFCQLPLRHGQCDQLTNHILSAPLRHGQCDQLTNHILSAPPPPRSVWSTHQSHYVSSPSATVSVINSPITFCQLPSATVSVINSPITLCQLPSATVSVINSPITFCQLPLRHGQCDQLTNHILSAPPPPRSVW